jgi:ABC-type transport system involved in multi-copper enzyme maturation permease subunit
MPRELITDRQKDPSRLGPSGPDAGPSLVREDEPSVARVFGFLGAVLIVFSGTVLFLARIGRPNPFVGTGLAAFLLALGVGGLLLHAAFDPDLQIRRIYLLFCGLGLLVGLGLYIAAPFLADAFLTLFFCGLICMGLALAFALAFLRNETDPDWVFVCQLGLGTVGTLAALIGLIGAFVNPGLLTWGVSLALLIGVPYLAFFIGAGGGVEKLNLGFWAGVGMGALGVLVVAAAVVRSAAPQWFTNTPVLAQRYFIPYGALLIAAGLVYLVAALLASSGDRFSVMVRRELGAFFFSPIAYLVLFGFVFFHGFSFAMFVTSLVRSQGPVPEPIVEGYLGQWWQIIFLIFLVPILTMRLLSEERRSGTLEVLLTAPVQEWQVVLSKFLASWLMFLIMWAPFFLYLIALRLANQGPEDKRDFDAAPLLGFALSLLVTGAGFVSIGLFFSSLTRDQITSGVLTFVVMLFLTLVFLLRRFFLQDTPEGTPNAWGVVLRHISYIDLWFESLRGQVMLRWMLFPFSLAVFFLFLSVKVLEARKWT